eukprot:10777114-Lingulodinium_polyedra.AAC.1
MHAHRWHKCSSWPTAAKGQITTNDATLFCPLGRLGPGIRRGNPKSNRATGKYQPSTAAEIREFRAWLRDTQDEHVRSTSSLDARTAQL